MSGLADDPGHLIRWAEEADIGHDGFLRRSDYGHYLSGLLADAERGARRGALEAAAGWLINGTGPAADVIATADPLIRYLLDSGLARADPLRLGLETDSRGALHTAGGGPASDIFTLGPPLRGRWYETTAIPEIRDQAALLARTCSRAGHTQGPRGAA